MRSRLRLLPLALSTLLAACSTAPHQKATEKPAEPVIVPPVAQTPVAQAPASATSEESPATSTVWERLRNSFQMPGCDADPAVLVWANRFVRSPQAFESLLRKILPRLVYVQKVASRHDVAGEFALLPWVESRFRPIPGKRRHAGGMWQIMPPTAGAIGLRVDRHYDARMDIPAAANAVMKMLAGYHDQFHDWRLTDYAYNAGEYSVRRIIRKQGLPPAEPVIPDWPVRKVTREHLIKLLAISCIVREPSRFHVTLPLLPKEQRLVKVPIPHSIPIARAADHAGLSVDILKRMNSAFRNDLVDARQASYLMLPKGHAQQFHDALLQARSSDSGKGQGSVPKPQVHTVRKGECLSLIAKHYAVGVADLKRWNRLHGNTLKPGQKLKIKLNR